MSTLHHYHCALCGMVKYVPMNSWANYPGKNDPRVEFDLCDLWHKLNTPVENHKPKKILAWFKKNIVGARAKL
jgi:hypothetical protein